MRVNSGLSITGPILKKNTRRAYAATLSKFLADYGHRDIYDLTSDEALAFLNKITEGKPKNTAVVNNPKKHVSSVQTAMNTGTTTEKEKEVREKISDRSIDGPVIFKDDFENGLKNWVIYTYNAEKQQFEIARDKAAIITVKSTTG